MSNLTLGTVTYSPAGDAPDSTSGKFWLSVVAGQRVQGVTEYEFPGIDGFGVKWLGYRGRMLQARTMYKGATRSAVLSAMESDVSTLSASLWDASLPDYPATISNCRLLTFAPGRVTPNASGGYIAVATITFKQEYE